MKTHSLAKALKSLAKILEAGPNVELSKLDALHKDSQTTDPKSVALNLKTLVSLSRINKQEWITLIDDYGFDIQFNQRDSARNIMGKLLTYLDSNPEAMDVLKKKSGDNKKKPSALTTALDILLEDI